MCILLLTTAHPDYPLIVLNNRDEFLHRPTQPAAFWEPPYSHIFSGRDLARPERGTWLGITRSGRLAVLTNFCEDSSAAAISQKSRGSIVTSFLTSHEDLNGSTESWLHRLLADGKMKGVGGFSLLCGILRPSSSSSDPKANLEKIAVICNRTAAGDEGVESSAHWIAGTKGETHGLSNSLFDDPWPKVVIGRNLLAETIENSAGKSEDELLEGLFAILSHDTMPVTRGKDSATQLEALRHSIFIPTFETSPETPETNGHDESVADESRGAEVAANSGDRVEHYCATPDEEEHRWIHPERLYGTHKQTVILLNKNGKVNYVERTLYDGDAKPVDRKDRDIVCKFDIDGWDDVPTTTA
ncbi:NRDE protein-domain-containing protein [Tuber indicum]|nr:NRDE protein-domain-containing protein [Tuber indicum]